MNAKPEIVPQWVIENKRDGKILTAEEIRGFLLGYTAGRIPDYQMAALAMAVYFQGLNPEETAVFTEAMLRSGELLDTSGIDRPVLDKHSTGGIGDKISLILAPLAAACGLAVPMISGRGLGITGGTLDKLESIPGYRTDLSPREIVDTVGSCGCAISGQTANLAPADRKLYALRDVTATVPSIPLITASIMSKKLAEGISGLALDVKFGSGAFMRDPDEARALADSLIAVGRSMNTGVRALISDMNQPLGNTAGNALEVAEACRVLAGEGPPDVRLLTIVLAAAMLQLAGCEKDEAAAQQRATAALDSGSALELFERMIELQGGEPRIVRDHSRLPRAAESTTWRSPAKGFVARADARAIGRAVLVMGGGRRQTKDAIDPAAGIDSLAKVGQPVEANEPLCRLWASSRQLLENGLHEIENAFAVTDYEPPDTQLIVENRNTE